MFYVIAYDVPNDKRRTRLAKELENWAVRVQGSVFECELDDQRAGVMIERLRQIVAKDDDLRIYQMCQACLGKSVVVRGGAFNIDPDFYQV